MVVLGLSTAFVGLCYLSSVAFIPVTVAAVVFYAYPSLIVLASPLVDGTRLTPRLLAVVAHCSHRHRPRRGSGLHRPRLARPCACAAARPPATATQFFAASRCPRRRSSPRSSGSISSCFRRPCRRGGDRSARLPDSTRPRAARRRADDRRLRGGLPVPVAALARLTAAAAGIAYCIEPVVSAVASIFVLGESSDPVQIVGGSPCSRGHRCQYRCWSGSPAAPLVPTD